MIPSFLWVDSWNLENIRKSTSNLCFLCQFFINEITTSDAGPDIIRSHLLQEDVNLAKARNVRSLHCLVASSVIKLATAEHITGSGLLNLQHLRLVWQRDGEDGLRLVFSIEKPSVTKDAKLLGNIIPKLISYFNVQYTVTYKN